MKRILFFLIFLFSAGLCSCATTYNHGQGIIIAEKKLSPKNYQPHEVTKIGATVGGSIGAMSGAAYGTLIGVLISALSDGSTPVIIASGIGGAALGAIILGGAGVIAGGGLGYVVDLSKRDALYEFVVKPKNATKSITIQQYTTPLPLHSKVQIYERDNVYYLKPAA